MRRMRMLFVIMASLCLVVGPGSTQASAQVPEEEVEGVITGNTEAAALQPLVHVTHDGQFEDVAITVRATRVDANGEVRTVEAIVESPHPVVYTAREDLLQGDGELHPTAADRQFRNRSPVLEVHSTTPPALACVELHINEGRFVRVGTVATADIEIRLMIERNPIGNNCHVDPPGDERFTTTVCGQAVVTAVPDPTTNFARAHVAGVASLRESSC